MLDTWVSSSVNLVVSASDNSLSIIDLTLQKKGTFRSLSSNRVQI